MVIQPQIIFVLQATPEVIYQRKQELNLEEISRQLSEFKKIELVSSNVIYIDANQSVAAMVNQAIEAIFDKFLYKI